MVHVAVSIVNYGKPNLVKACIDSLKRLEGDVAPDIFVVDNFSGEKNRLELYSLLDSLKSVHLIPLQENLGFAAGNNVAIDKILKSDRCDYIWLLNSDCQVAPTSLSNHIIAAKNNPEVVLWGSSIVEADGDIIQVAGGCFYSPWLTTFKQFAKGRPASAIDSLVEPEFDYIAGASLFFTREGINRALIQSSTQNERKQYLNEEFFLYFEELDLAQRIGKNAMGWCKEAKVHHLGGATTIGKGRRFSAAAEFHSNLSALKFTKFYHPEKMWTVYSFRLFVKVMQLLFYGQFRLISSIFKAYREYHCWCKERL